MEINTTTHDRKVAYLGQLMTAVALAGTLGACGGGGGDSTSSSSPAPAPTSAPTPAAPTPTAGDQSATVTAATYAAGSPEASAYATLNAARLAGGFGTLAQKAPLDSEAANQAEFSMAHYTVTNTTGGVNVDPNVTGGILTIDSQGNETVHTQPSTYSSYPDYTGYLPWNRATHFGYGSTDVSESAALGGYAGNIDIGADCVSLLLGSPSHRQLMLEPRYRDVGIGLTIVDRNAAVNSKTFGCYIATAAEAFAYSATGQATAPTNWVGIFPPDGSTVSSTGDGHGRGYAPSVTVDSHLTLTVNSFVITDPAGNVVPVTMNADALGLLSPTWPNWSFATPDAPLQKSTTYTVNFQGSAAGTAIAKVWHFTTPAN
jgi:uncharacterized protein YkwD